MTRVFSGTGLQYPLEWLDRLVTVSLNPSKINLETVKTETLNTILNRLKQEDEKLRLLIKSQTFVLDEQDSSVLVRRYHSSLVALVQHILRNQSYLKKTPVLIAMVDAVVDCLDGLLEFIEECYSSHLSLEERVPPNYLSGVKRELPQRLETLKERLDAEQKAKPVLKLLFKRLLRIVQLDNSGSEVTLRMVLYDRELISELEKIDWAKPAEACYAVHELLIHMNFNCKAYIKLLTAELAKVVNGCVSTGDKMDKLLLYQKAYNQIQSRPGMVFNPKYHNLETVLRSWFELEIAYLGRSALQLGAQVPAGVAAHKKDEVKAPSVRQKVTCMLSTDQMGLIIRGADESRVILARSMTEVFKTLVPHLSSPYKEELSYDGMRSKSYVAEDRDKKTAIDALEKIIRKIKGY